MQELQSHVLVSLYKYMLGPTGDVSASCLKSFLRTRQVLMHEKNKYVILIYYIDWFPSFMKLYFCYAYNDWYHVFNFK